MINHPEMGSWKWARRFMRLAFSIATWSKDLRTKVGAIAVDPNTRHILAEGYNGLPRGVRDIPERMLPPQKYDWTLHAEANVVAHAARSVLAGSTVYVTHCCCAQCAALLINAGVAKVIVDAGTKTNMPPEKFEIAKMMFHEAGVEFYDKDLSDDSIQPSE